MGAQEQGTTAGRDVVRGGQSCLKHTHIEYYSGGLLLGGSDLPRKREASPEAAQAVLVLPCGTEGDGCIQVIVH